MVGGSEADSAEQQGVKRIVAAASNDYERERRWAEYWSNVLIPPDMDSRSSVLLPIHHFKRKLYNKYIAITSRNRTTAGGMDASSTRLDRQLIQFFINLWIFAIVLLAIVPLVPRSLSGKAYRLSLLGIVSSSLYTLYIYHGKPEAWNLPAFQTWFHSIIVTTDFIYLVYCLMFIPFPANFKFALQPLLCRVIEQNAKFLRRNFSSSSFYRKYLDDACLWVEANLTTLNILSSNAEVELGFLLIFSLISWQRSVIQAVIYWQLLKLMYHAPATASYHQSVWAAIGQFVNPLIHRCVPFLNAPLSAVQRWWLN